MSLSFWNLALSLFWKSCLNCTAVYRKQKMLKSSKFLQCLEQFFFKKSVTHFLPWQFFIFTDHDDQDDGDGDDDGGTGRPLYVFVLKYMFIQRREYLLTRQPAAFQIPAGSQALIGRFETACIPWIPLDAEFGTDHIEKAVFLTSALIETVGGMEFKFGEEIAKKNSSIKIRRHSGEIFSIFALIPVWSGGGRGWRPLSCKPCLPLLS